MRLFLEENLVTGNTLTPDGVLAYIALRKMMDENIFLKSLEITEDCVSINRMAYTLVGVSEKYPKAFTDALQRGIYELDAVDRIKIVQSFGKGIEFVLDMQCSRFLLCIFGAGIVSAFCFYGKTYFYNVPV